MATQFPSNNDSFGVPSNGAATALSSPGDSTRDHITHHHDIGDAVVALEQNVALLTHDHSGTGSRATNKLSQANTHQGVDTDSSTTAIHHTLGSLANQASPGSHNHNGVNSANLPQSSIIGLTAALGSPLSSASLSQLSPNTNTIAGGSTRGNVIWAPLNLNKSNYSSTNTSIAFNSAGNLVLYDAGAYYINVICEVQAVSTDTAFESGVRVVDGFTGTQVSPLGHDTFSPITYRLMPSTSTIVVKTGSTAYPYTVQAWSSAPSGVSRNIIVTCLVVKLALS